MHKNLRKSNLKHSNSR